MKPERADFRPERADFMLERANFRPEKASLHPEMVDFRPERVNFRTEKANSRPKRANFRPEKPDGGGTNGQTNRWTNENPPVFYRTSSPSGPLLCFLSLKLTIMQSRAKGIADHILPLGDWFNFLIDGK